MTERYLFHLAAREAANGDETGNDFGDVTGVDYQAKGETTPVSGDGSMLAVLAERRRALEILSLCESHSNRFPKFMNIASKLVSEGVSLEIAQKRIGQTLSSYDLSTVVDGHQTAGYSSERDGGEKRDISKAAEPGRGAPQMGRESEVVDAASVARTIALLHGR